MNAQCDVFCQLWSAVFITTLWLFVLYRVKKRIQQKTEDEERMRSALTHQLTVARKQAMRATREKHIQILGMLPASAIPRHLENMREQSAVTIQAVWRGHNVRRDFSQRKHKIVRVKSAVIIQRWVSVTLSVIGSLLFTILLNIVDTNYW